MVKLIGISAHAARSGKDTLAQCLQVVLAEKGKTSAIKSLASPLKEKTKDFILNEFGIDIYNCTDKEKSLVRPLLVAYGGARRKQTEGKYWTRLMDDEISRLRDSVDFVIVPDIRYCEFPGDECDWIKNKGGTLFYIKMRLDDGSILPPPNEDEERNSPKLEAAADVNIEWKHMNFESCLQFVRQNFHTYQSHLQ